MHRPTINKRFYHYFIGFQLKMPAYSTIIFTGNGF